MTPVLIAGSGWLILTIWCLALFAVWETLLTRWLKPRAAGLSEPGAWPMLSVIVPARNEAAQIEQGLRSLLNLNYPGFEIVAIDDRSTDTTGACMERLAEQDPRISVLHVTELPPGWLGKNHALHLGGQAARGELLLFTDGDVIFARDSLRLAVSYVQHRQLDHLCLAPELIPGSVLENAASACFGLLFISAANPWLIGTTFKHAYSGVGAFNLIRREAYESVQGHQTIRLDVLDDVNLGKLLKYSGFRQEFLLAGDLVRVRWQDSLWGVIRGLEKNGFASFQYSLVKLVIVSLFLLSITFLPYMAVLMLRNARVVPYAATLLLMHGTFGWLGWRFGGGLRVAPLFPIAMLLFLFAMWRSAWMTLRQGGVRWRDTFYPLPLLKENLFVFSGKVKPQQKAR